MRGSGKRIKAAVQSNPKKGIQVTVVFKKSSLGIQAT